MCQTNNYYNDSIENRYFTYGNMRYHTNILTSLAPVDIITESEKRERVRGRELSYYVSIGTKS